MKKVHIFLLVLLSLLTAWFISYSTSLTTYDTLKSAALKQGQYVHIIASLDRNSPIVYDPVQNPNYLEFHALDSSGYRTKIIYHNVKPAELEQSAQILLKGAMQDGYFDCQEILLKCPSKYKDEQLGKIFADKRGP